MAVKRVLALLLAVGMVAGAFAIRGRIEGREAAGGPDAHPGGTVLLCDPQLAEICEAIAAEAGTVVVQELPSEASIRLAGNGADIPHGAWLTLAPWPEIARLRREAAGEQPIVGEEQVLARSPLVLAIWEHRADRLASACPGLDLQCVGEAARGPWADVGGDDAWGSVKPGLPDPTRTSEGLLVLGQLAAAFFGGTDVSRNTIREDPGFAVWFSGLQRQAANLPLADMVTFGPAQIDLLAVMEAEAAPLLERTRARAGDLQLRVLDPVATADVVVTAIGDDGGARDLAEQVASMAPALLAEAGWRVEAQPLAPAVEHHGVQLEPGLPAENGLPTAGTLLALQELWQEVR